MGDTSDYDSHDSLVTVSMPTMTTRRPRRRSIPVASVVDPSFEEAKDREGGGFGPRRHDRVRGPEVP